MHIKFPKQYEEIAKGDNMNVKANERIPARRLDGGGPL